MEWNIIDINMILFELNETTDFKNDIYCNDKYSGGGGGGGEIEFEEEFEDYNLLSMSSITRLARKGGVKSISRDAIQEIQKILVKHLFIILKKCLIIRDERNTKILTPIDLKTVLRILNNKYILEN